MSLFILYESASGYALFEKAQADDVADQNQQIQQAVGDASLFKKMVKLKAFFPFTSAENALENCNDVSEGVLNDTLKTFLTNNLAVKSGKSSKFTLGVSEEKLGSAIQEATGIKCEKSSVVLELIRGIRFHFGKFVPDLETVGLQKAQLGLGHSYSRAKVKFNVNRVDNMIIQSIAILDQMDKDINTFSMRCREWYSWHFPELSKIIADQKMFARLARTIKDKATLTEENLDEITQITGDAEKSNEILEAAKASMGTDISEIDMINIEKFADRVISLAEYREQLHSYLLKKMGDVAPNLSTLVGEQVGARLISHAGSLTNLSKMPASTVQILGAEKALFRALKTRGNTPKYGLIYHSSFIGRAGANKGRISRYLANKCTIAARIDNFSDNATTKFGERMKDQVEERLKFYDSGVAPRKNIDVMKEVLEEVKQDGLIKEAAEKKNKKKDKKRKSEGAVPEAAVPTPKDKKKKKSKVVEEEAMEVEEVAPQKREHKKKSRKSQD